MPAGLRPRNTASKTVPRRGRQVPRGMGLHLARPYSMGSLRHAAGARVSAGAETGDVAKIVVRDARADHQLALQDIFQRAPLGKAGDREALLSHPEALQLSPDLISAGRTRVATRADGKVV